MHTVHGSSAVPCHLSVWSTIDEVQRSNTTSFSGGGATAGKGGLDGNTYGNTCPRANGCPQGSCLEDSPCSRTRGRIRSRSGRSVGQLSNTADGSTLLGSSGTSRKSDCNRSSSSTSNKRQPSTSNSEQPPGIGFVVFRKCKQLAGWVRDAVWMDLTSSASSDSLSTSTRGSLVDEQETHGGYRMPTNFTEDVSSGECSSVTDSVAATTVNTSVNRRRRPSGASEEACRCTSGELPASREDSGCRGHRSNRECRSCSHHKRTSASSCSDCTPCCETDSRCGGDCEPDNDDQQHVQNVGGNPCRQRNPSRAQSLQHDGKHSRWSGVARTISNIWDHIKDELLASSSSSGSESDYASCNEESPRLSSGSATLHFAKTRPDPTSRCRSKSPRRGSNITLPQHDKFTRRHVRNSRCL